MLFALQNGSYGSRLFSPEYTEPQNARMAEATFSLCHSRNHLLRHSVDRYERLHHAYQDINSEITKRMNSKDFPDTILPLHRHSLQSLQEAFRTRWASLISDLGYMDQINRSYIEAMYACSTNALSQELEEASRLRLYPIVVHPLVRQVAQSQDPSTPTRGLKRSRSSSADSVRSDQSIQGAALDAAEAEAAAAAIP